MDKKIFLSVAALLLLSGCTADDYDSVTDLTPVEFSCTVDEKTEEGGTRAGTSVNNSFTASTTASSATHLSVSVGGSYKDYYCISVSSSTYTLASSAPGYYPAGTSTTASVFAVYPLKSGGYGTGSQSFSVNTDQTTDANYQASDLIASNTLTYKKGGSNSALTMKHLMSKIVVQVTLASAISSYSITGVSLLNTKKTTTFTPGSNSDLSTGNASTAATITIGGTMTSGSSVAAVIPPQVISSGTNLVQVTVKNGNTTYTTTYKLASNFTCTSGKTYTYNMTIGLADLNSTVTLTGWTGSGNATVNPTVVTEVYRQAVDLGLPSGVKWANMNVGASSPTDYGMYFMWGDVAGHPGAKDGDDNATDGFSFEWANYKWTTDGGSTFTKYTGSDGKTTLEAADDAATANWGGKWCMPTETEMQELVDTKSNTTDYAWTWCDGSSVKYNNTTVKGWKIESKKSGTAGNHIFLPAASYRTFASFNDLGSLGMYWSSALNTDNPNCACFLYLDSSYASVDSDGRRFMGFTVRPVTQ